MKTGIRMAAGSFVFALSMGALAQTVPPAVRQAEASIDPEKIRGFGPVKMRHLKAAKAEEAALLERWRLPQPPLLDAAE